MSGLQALLNRKIIICCGSGGVGKTTTSAALAIVAAQQGKRVLVLTIDPARRLATTLGIDQTADEVLVPGQQYQGQLYAGMIHPQKIFDDFIRRAADTSAMAERVFANSLYQQLSTTLSGSQEFTSLVKLHDVASSGKYDLVILDTPPSAHAAAFLQAPENLNAVFDGDFMRFFIDDNKSGLSFAFRAWRQGVRAVFKALATITGAEFIQQIEDFFYCIEGIAPDIREKNRMAHDLLLSADTAFVLITSFDQAKIQEGERFYRQLQNSGYHLQQVIVNRCWPQWLMDSNEQLPEPAAALREKMQRYYHQRSLSHTVFADLIKIPEFERDICGLSALEDLAKLLTIV